MLHGLGTVSHGDEDIYAITDDVEAIKTMITEHRETTSVFALPAKESV